MSLILLKGRLLEGAMASGRVGGIKPPPPPPGALVGFASDGAPATALASLSAPVTWTYAVERRQNLSGTSTVTWTAATPLASSAFAPGTAFAGTLTFAPGDSRKQLPFTLLAQAAGQDNSSLALTITAASNCTLEGAATATTVLVMPGAPPPSPAVGFVSPPTVVLAAEAASVTFGYDIDRTIDTSGTSTASWTATTPLSAGAFAAGTVFSGTFTWSPGQVRKQLSFTLLQQTAGTPNSTFTVTLTPVTNCVLAGSATAATTIDMPDIITPPPPAPQVKHQGPPTSVTASNTGPVTISYPLARIIETTQACSITWTATTDLATNQFTGWAASGTKSFAPGETAKTVQFTLVAQPAGQIDKNLTLVIAPGTNCTISGSATASTTIVTPPAQTPTAADFEFELADNSDAQSIDIGAQNSSRATGSVFALVSGTGNVPTRGVLGTLNTSTGVVTYDPNAGFTSGVDSFKYKITNPVLLGGLTSAAATVTVKRADAITALTGDKLWHRESFGYTTATPPVRNTTDPRNGRPFCSGTMAIGAKDHPTWKSYMGLGTGAKGAAVMGGRCHLIGKGPDWDLRTDTWEKLIGGPFTGDDAIASFAPTTHHMLELNWLNNTKDWNSRNLATKDDWLAMHCTSMPIGFTRAQAEAVASGTTHDAKYVLMGARLRYWVDNRSGTSGNRQDHKRVILRLNYEMNQDTGLQSAAGSFFELNWKDLVGDSISVQRTRALTCWRAMMTKAISKIWEGYGYAIPVALSPAMTSGGIPKGWTLPTYQELYVPEFALICASFHPIHGSGGSRCPTAAAAKNLVYGRNTGFYTPQEALDCAIANNRLVAFFEHSLPFDEAIRIGDVRVEGACNDKNIKYCANAYHWFGKFCNDNPRVAFTGQLLNDQCNEGSRGTWGYWNTARAEQTASWIRKCRTVRYWFGDKANAFKLPRQAGIDDDDHGVPVADLEGPTIAGGDSV